MSEFQSKYSERVRVSPENLDWLKEQRGSCTIAGYLDKIINEHKQQHERIGDEV